MQNPLVVKNLLFKKDHSFQYKSDLVIKSLGFDPENIPHYNFLIKKSEHIKLGNNKNERFYIQYFIYFFVVFAAGPQDRGASLVVWAT